MELLLNELDIGTVHGNTLTQALVEGEIPFPEGQTLKKLLDVSGDVNADKIEVTDGSVKLEGRVRVELICEDDEAKVFSFASWASFSHTITMTNAKSGMKAQLQVELQTLDAKVMLDAVRLSAIVDIACRVVGDSPIMTVNSIGGVSDMEMKEETFSVKKRCEAGKCTARLRDEIAAPGVSCILFSSGNAVIREIRREGMDAIVDGNLTVNALCMDKEGKYSQLTQYVPFSEIVELEVTMGELSGEVLIDAVQIRVLGEEFGILAVEAQLSITLFASETANIKVPLDAYSPSCPFECVKQRMKLLIDCGAAESSLSITENVNVPDGLPDIYRVVWSSARMVLTASTVEDGCLAIEGLIFLRVVYQCDKGVLHSFLEDIPFKCNIPVSAENGAQADVNLQCMSTQASGAGKGFDVKFSLMIDANLYTIQDADVVTGAQECEKKDLPHGIVIYFAGGSETLFDVGKRFNVSREILKANDPSLKENLNEGQKLIMFV